MSENQSPYGGRSAKKLSVTVPSALYEAAQRARPDIDSPSALVQEALRTLAEKVRRRRRPEPRDPEARKQRVAQLAEEAANLYARGYERGEQMVNALTFAEIELFDRVKYDFDRWKEVLLDVDSGDWTEAGPGLSGMDLEGSTMFWQWLDRAPSTWMRGLADALKDYYEQACAYEDAMGESMEYDAWKEGQRG